MAYLRIPRYSQKLTYFDSECQSQFCRLQQFAGTSDTYYFLFAIKDWLLACLAGKKPPYEHVFCD